MSNYFLKTFHAVVASRGKSVRDSAAQYGGHCTWAFSQCEPPIVTQILRTEDTQGGVCEALSAHWILYHANDLALCDRLFPGGRLDLNRMFQVMNLQAAGMQASGAWNQDEITRVWLGQRGIRQLKSSVCYWPSEMNGNQYVPFRAENRPAKSEGRTEMFSVNTFLTFLRKNTTRPVGPTGPAGGAYYKISFEGKFGAHAMAAWVAEDLAFFDPNFGEFWFEKPLDFARWFQSEFWHRSLFSAGLSGKYWLFPFAKVMPFALYA